MSLSLISCPSLGSLAQLIFWTFLFVAVSLVKNKDFKGHLHWWSGVNIYYIPLSRDKHTDFIQCCWLFCTVSQSASSTNTSFCNCTGTPCNSFRHKQANWRWFCEKHTYQQSHFEKAERTPRSFWCFSGPYKGKLGLIYLCCTTHDLWILSRVPWSLGAFFTPAVIVLGWWCCCSDHYLGSYLVTWKAICRWNLFSFLLSMWGSIAY